MREGGREGGMRREGVEKRGERGWEGESWKRRRKRTSLTFSNSK